MHPTQTRASQTSSSSAAQEQTAARFLHYTCDAAKCRTIVGVRLHLVDLRYANGVHSTRWFVQDCACVREQGVTQVRCME